MKGKAVRRDGRIALCIDDDTPPYAFVLIEGTTTVGDDLTEMLHWATLIGARYMGADRAEEFGRRNAVPEEIFVRVTPAKIIALSGVAS
jgi:PPOX class probable F420-dependent enzyme